MLHLIKREKMEDNHKIFELIYFRVSYIHCIKSIPFYIFCSHNRLENLPKELFNIHSLEVNLFCLLSWIGYGQEYDCFTHIVHKIALTVNIKGTDT